VSDILVEHGYFAGVSKKKYRELLRENANLTAVADIYDRVTGAQDVYYDIFDELNDSMKKNSFKPVSWEYDDISIIANKMIETENMCSIGRCYETNPEQFMKKIIGISEERIKQYRVHPKINSIQNHNETKNDYIENFDDVFNIFSIQIYVFTTNIALISIGITYEKIETADRIYNLGHNKTKSGFYIITENGKEIPFTFSQVLDELFTVTDIEPFFPMVKSTDCADENVFHEAMTYSTLVLKNRIPTPASPATLPPGAGTTAMKPSSRRSTSRATTSRP
jgi:hypothetical protein